MLDSAISTAVEPWKLLFQSVRGPGHERTGQPCQDRCLARLKYTRESPILLLACADGSGSASCSEIGAALTCQTMIRLVQQDLADGLPLTCVERDTAVSWLVRLRGLLQQQAQLLETDLGQLACTLLLAVVSVDAAVFVQVGDGAMVALEGSEYRPIFWPRTGEYANTTYFVTQEDFAEHVAFERRQQCIDELALFSDGLQMLALHFASRTAHQPFFRPLFERLRNSTPGERLPAALQRFLTSPAVSSRGDDDKTLILATRVPSRGPTQPL